MTNKKFNRLKAFKEIVLKRSDSLFVLAAFIIIFFAAIISIVKNYHFLLTE